MIGLFKKLAEFFIKENEMVAIEIDTSKIGLLIVLMVYYFYCWYLASTVGKIKEQLEKLIKENEK